MLYFRGTRKYLIYTAPPTGADNLESRKETDMSDKFDEHDLEYRVFRRHFESLGFSSRLAGKLHDLMQDAHAELCTIGSSIPTETLAAYPEIVSLAITYGKWHPRSTPIDEDTPHYSLEDYKARTRLLDQWLLEERVEKYVSEQRVRSIDSYRDDLAGEMAAYPMFPITFPDEVDDDRNIADYADA